MTMEAFGEESFGQQPWENTGWDLEPGWLSEQDLADTRGRVPILYVEALPVRVEPDGRIGEVGLLLRGSPTTGQITRSLVSGRVLHGERIRDALMRNLEKDLGSTAFPVLPSVMTPGAVAEYFPWPGERLHDPRQHAVALCYVVPVTGECQPRQDALELTWMKPADAVSDVVAAEMDGGRGSLVRQLLYCAGALA
jgi:ADP-ribose pyrophosphatase YjhB (NUDIX family)